MPLGARVPVVPALGGRVTLALRESGRHPEAGDWSSDETGHSPDSPIATATSGQRRACLSTPMEGPRPTDERIARLEGRYRRCDRRVGVAGDQGPDGARVMRAKRCTSNFDLRYVVQSRNERRNGKHSVSPFGVLACQVDISVDGVVQSQLIPIQPELRVEF